jgi:hypothetical protein
VGKQIEITLGTVGPKKYGAPEVSSPAIRLENTALDWPPNPGGPTYMYIFTAAAEGEAQITVPIDYANDPYCAERKQHTFVLTIRVGSARRNSLGLRASLAPDQSNTALWKNAWTNLRSARQDFVPSLPRLIGVEVELVVANPGPDTDEVNMSLANAAGAGLAFVSKTVEIAHCSHVLFLFPKGGLQVLPGQVYSIVLNGDRGVFGWKYVANGYPNGAASLNGKPLSRDTRSTFLFRTFGRN